MQVEFQHDYYVEPMNIPIDVGAMGSLLVGGYQVVIYKHLFSGVRVTVLRRNGHDDGTLELSVYDRFDLSRRRPFHDFDLRVANGGNSETKITVRATRVNGEKK